MGKRAMTSAERAARHRARVKAAVAPEEAKLSAALAADDPPRRPAAAEAMTQRWPPDDLPRPVWQPDGDNPLPTASEAMGMSLRAFPSWFLRIVCDRCGKARMLDQAHATAGQGNMRLRDFIARARHEGCGGRAARVELITGVEGVPSRPVRRIVLRAG
jgi:hypothetical protein